MIPVDKYARSIRRPDLSYPETFALKYFDRKFQTKLEKARAVYTWIAENIKWDAKIKKKKLGNKSLGGSIADDEESPELVLKQKRARRDGFARLFQSMAMGLGLVCNVVHGYLKSTVSYSVYSK